MVSQIAYLSLSKTLSGEAQLSDILAVSKTNNTRDGITGILMYHDRLFFQLLEGERSIVDKCYNRILCDPRHSAISLMWNGEAENRTFSAWAMGFVGTNEIDLNSEHELVSLTDVAGSKDASTNSGCLALQMSLQMFQMFWRVKNPFS